MPTSTARHWRERGLARSRPRTSALLGAALAVACVLAASPSFAAPLAPQAAKAPPAPVSAPAGAQRQEHVIEGDDHLFMVAPPPGWVIDDTSGMGSRIRCVFYRKGETWATASTVMYVNPLHGYGARTRTVTTLIAEDEKAFHKRAPRGTVREGGSMSTSSRKTARVRYFSDTGGAPMEAVAYVAENDLVMLLVLTSRTPDGFRQALDAYRQMVESYAWVGSNRELGR